MIKEFTYAPEEEIYFNKVFCFKNFYFFLKGNEND